MWFFLRSWSGGLQVKFAWAAAFLAASSWTNATSAQQRAAAATQQGSSDTVAADAEDSSSAATDATTAAKPKRKLKREPPPSEPAAAEAESGGDEVDLNESPPQPAAKAPTRRTRTKAEPADGDPEPAADSATATKARWKKGGGAKALKPSSSTKPRVKRVREPPADYVKMRDSWHAPLEPQLTPALSVTGRMPLVLSRVLGGDGSVTLIPQRDDGGFSDEDLQRAAASAFCPKEAKKVHPISPRLLDLVYKAMLHFKAPLVHVVSGYRPDRAGSRHTQGRAIDMVLPGVTNEQLADYVRTFGFVGVGIYPTSGFVHLDVRDVSYFWVDNSLPDERSRAAPILGNLAIASDRAAAARGEAPDTWVPHNDAEDRAAARTYARRAKARRGRALRQQARESAKTLPANASDEPAVTKEKAAVKAAPPSFSAAGMLE